MADFLQALIKNPKTALKNVQNTNPILKDVFFAIPEEYRQGVTCPTRGLFIKRWLEEWAEKMNQDDPAAAEEPSDSPAKGLEPPPPTLHHGTISPQQARSPQNPSPALSAPPAQNFAHTSPNVSLHAGTPSQHHHAHLSPSPAALNLHTTLHTTLHSAPPAARQNNYLAETAAPHTPLHPHHHPSPAHHHPSASQHMSLRQQQEELVKQQMQLQKLEAQLQQQSIFSPPHQSHQPHQYDPYALQTPNKYLGRHGVGHTPARYGLEAQDMSRGELEARVHDLENENHSLQQQCVTKDAKISKLTNLVNDLLEQFDDSILEARGDLTMALA